MDTTDISDKLYEDMWNARQKLAEVCKQFAFLMDTLNCVLAHEIEGSEVVTDDLHEHLDIREEDLFEAIGVYLDAQKAFCESLDEQVVVVTN